MLSLFSLTQDLLNKAPKRLTRGLKPWLLDGKSPAARLTIISARKEWRLIVINFISSVFEALTEGATLGVIFLAVELLTSSGNISWQTKPFAPFIAWLPHFTSHIPTKALFIALLGLALILQAFQSLARYINSVSAGLFGARLNSTITSLVHAQILAFTFACASRFRVGDLLNTAGTAPRAIEGQINLFSAILVNTILSMCYLAILVALSPWLLLAAIILGLFLTQFQSRVTPVIKRLSHHAVEASVDVYSTITQDIQGLRLIHSSGLTKEASQDLDTKIACYEKAIRRQIVIKEILIPMTSFLPIFGIAIIAGLSVVFFGAKSTGILPSLITFVLALQRLNQRFASIANSFSSLASNAGSIERLNMLLRPDDKEYRRDGGVAFGGLNRSIMLQDISLSYDSGNPPALKKINLVIPRGSTVALVGSSGSGKSSLADLLVGLFEPTSGQIYIDDVPLQNYDLSSWQHHIGVVSQDTFLFNSTLAENISYGAANFSKQDIVNAARLAQADRFISELPAGYETIVGERGYKLSGGQRQRISLARALLKHPSFLILDEATSALDSRNERLVQAAIEKLDANITILIIAHRLSTIIKADLICVMESGTIVEQGSHSELLEIQGKYYQLWQQQLHSSQAELISN
ncbi:MAG: ABC transporter ATP-binding protein [Synechococcaceae cyanobacterium]|nr:ABC transporter ATP-binding protein [Synechococcaceae cyanobacterium]